MNCDCPRCGSENAYFDSFTGYYNCPECDYVWGNGYGNCLNFIVAKKENFIKKISNLLIEIFSTVF